MGFGLIAFLGSRTCDAGHGSGRRASQGFTVCCDAKDASTPANMPICIVFVVVIVYVNVVVVMMGKRASTQLGVCTGNGVGVARGVGPGLKLPSVRSAEECIVVIALVLDDD